MALTDRATLSWNCGPKGRAGQGGRATSRGNCLKLTGANLTSIDGNLTNWTAAAGELSNATVVRQAIDHGTDTGNTPPNNTLNKGEKWVITMQETSGNQRFFTHTIPSPIETGNVIVDTLDADLTSSAWVAYITAVNALLTTPDGNAMSLIGATILTRRR